MHKRMIPPVDESADKMLVQLTTSELRALIREEVANAQAAPAQTQTAVRWVDVTTTAEHFKCTTQTIRNWIKLGAPARNIGAASRPMWRINLSDFDRWIRNYQPRKEEESSLDEVP